MGRLGGLVSQATAFDSGHGPGMEPHVTPCSAGILLLPLPLSLPAAVLSLARSQKKKKKPKPKN